MINYDDKKKKIFYIIILILTLFTSLIGLAFALYTSIYTGNEEGEKLYTGTVEINYTDGVVIENPVLWPISKPSLTTTKYVYKNNFVVTSTGTLDQVLTVYLDITENEFLTGAIKYAIYDGAGNEKKTGDVPKSGKIAMVSDLFLAHGKSGNYTMLLWLGDDGTNQNYEQGKKVKGTISVLANQYVGE